jgi:alpha-D-xyloside xylohydrolase
MYISPARIDAQSSDQSRTTSRWGWSSRLIARLTMGVSLATLGTAATAAPIATVDRNGSLVSVEAYAPNIVRVTIATDRGRRAPRRWPQRKARCRRLDAS